MRVRLIKPVIVRTLDGEVIQRLEVGEVREVTADHGHYWVSCPPIYKDECVPVEEPIDERYIQLSNN